MRPHYDLILVGAGLANGLIALRLQQQQPDMRILLIEAAPRRAVIIPGPFTTLI